MRGFAARVVVAALFTGLGLGCTAEAERPAPTGKSRSAAAEDFAALDVAQACRLTSDCCAASGFVLDMATCADIFNRVKGLAGELEGATAAIVAGPNVVYDDVAATQCLNAIAGLGCGDIDAASYKPMIEACFSVYTGTLPAGSTCAATLECAPGNYCDPATGACAPLKLAGDACVSADECAYRGVGGACDAGLCVGARPDGDACVVGLECSSGLCDGVCVRTTATPFTAEQCVTFGGRPATKLLVTEIGSTWYSTGPRTSGSIGSSWLEIRNVSSSPVDLAEYSLRSRALDLTAPAAPTTVQQFTLPSLVLPPGGHAVLRGLVDVDLVDGPSIVHLKSGDLVPSWNADGFVELVSAATGATEDYVSFGAESTAPLTASAWGGAPAPSLPFSSADLGQSIARDLASTDTNTAADWVPRLFATFAGPNDVTCDDDVDSDGIPDCSEVPSGTFAGMPVYRWGARPGQRDIFMEIDWMDPNGKGVFDAGMQPRREALDKVAEVFARNGYILHFDVGDLYDGTPDINPANWDLGGGDMVPFRCSARLRELYEIKATSMAPPRKQLFYYALFVNVQEPLDCMTRSGSSGVAELPGNDLIVALGNFGLQDNTASNRNRLINNQATTLMHEFGHNLGLRHGGFENTNYKPNYLSVMNYMYQLSGLPAVGHPSEGDRYYNRFRPVCGVFNNIRGTADLHNSAFTTTFDIEYSDGSGIDLDEQGLDETKGLGRAGSYEVDFNEDGVIATSVSAAVALNDTPLTCGARTPGRPVLLKDHNDWGAVSIFAPRTRGGDRNGAARRSGPAVSVNPEIHRSRLDDVQPTIVVEEDGH